jgi:hypothetical protein
MIDRSFVKSRKLNALPRDHRLIYASILPFLDRKGRIVAVPIVLMAEVFRWSDFTVDEVAQALASLADAGLIRLYADEDNEAILEYVRFLDFNSPNKNEAKSDLPGPDDDEATELRDASIVPFIGRAHAMHVQRTDASRALQMENGTERKRERERERKRIDEFDSPEARFQRLAETGSSEHQQTSRTRATLRRLAGQKFVANHEEDLLAWSRWTDEQLRDLWNASDPRLWPGEERKRRAWLFVDLLNEDRKPGGAQADSPIDDLLRRYMNARGMHEGEEFTVIAAAPDGKTLVTDGAGYLTPDQVEEGMACLRN